MDTETRLEVGAAMRRCDPLLFMEALLPIDADTMTAGMKAAKKVMGCQISVVDTITALNGKLRAWLHSDSDGIVTQRRYFDRAAILASWRQNGGGAVTAHRVSHRETLQLADAVPFIAAGVRLPTCQRSGVQLPSIRPTLRTWRPLSVVLTATWACWTWTRPSNSCATSTTSSGHCRRCRCVGAR